MKRRMKIVLSPLAVFQPSPSVRSRRPAPPEVAHRPRSRCKRNPDGRECAQGRKAVWGLRWNALAPALRWLSGSGLADRAKRSPGHAGGLAPANVISAGPP